MIVLCNGRKGNNYLVATILAQRFDCGVVTAEENPALQPFNPIILVIPNRGDEELPQPMEEYLLELSVRNKDYLICELGNYFGFENYCGCKKVACRILDNLGWTRLADVSIDSLPELDRDSLDKWLETISFLAEDNPPTCPAATIPVVRN
jgi:hypothetical protein